MSEKGKIKIKSNQPGIIVKPVSDKQAPIQRSGSTLDFKKWGIIAGGGLFAILCSWALIGFFSSDKSDDPCMLSKQEILASHLHQRYELSPCTDTLWESGILNRRYFLTRFFEEKGLPVEVARNLQAQSDELASLVAGSAYAIIYDKKSQKPSWFVYEKTDFSSTMYPLGKENSKIKYVERKQHNRATWVVGELTKGLNHSFSTKNIPYEVSDQFRKILKWQVDFSHLYYSDRYEILYEKIYADSFFVKNGKVLALTFETEAKTVEAFLCEEKGFEGYYDKDGNTLKRGFLMSPIKNPRITSFFGNRKHPLHKKMKLHKGTDFAAPQGEEIIAVADGEVEVVGPDTGPNGNWVKIDHGNGYKSFYLHMLSFAEGMKPGVQVQQGQVIGLVGNTGDSSGPHVCFNLKQGNRFVDHITASLPGAFSLPEPYLSRFKKQMERYQSQMK